MAVRAGGAEERSSVIDVPRGLFCLRYAEPVDGNGPIVFFQPVFGSEHLLQVTPYPGASSSSFERPGEFAVVSSLGGARLQITVRAAYAGASTQARLELHPFEVLLPALAEQNPQRPPEYIPAPRNSDLGTNSDLGKSSFLSPSQTFPATSAFTANSTFPSRQVSSSANVTRTEEAGSDVGLAVIGHVARQGNVTVAPGEWVAGPSAPAPIEGLYFQMTASAAFWLEAQVLIAGDAAWTEWRTANQFLGTQGRARPLIGVRLRAAQGAPADFEMEASALFLGSPVVSAKGRQMELRSTAGGDPLVGLKFELHRRPSAPPAYERGPTVSNPARGRVRVFRAGIERVAS